MSRPTGVSNKRLRPIPCDYEKTISDVTLLAKKRAISLLDKCLNNHHLNASEQRDLILDVSRAFELSLANNEVSIGNNDSDAEGNTQNDKQRISTRICTGSSKESNTRKKDDDHNEVCEVCEKGGDLLCCDTCSLVFHLGCIRPKIASIPKGKWSCAHCVSDGVGTGDGISAKKALAMMGRLSRGLESEDENDDSGVNAKNNRNGDIVVIRSGKRFIVRKLAHSQIVELGRYDNLDDALGSIKPVYKKVLTVSSSGTADGESPMVTTPIGAVEDDDLWCTHCMDDPAVAVCAFCGCRTCFGKHNSEYLLLCDYCDQESHTYCLLPQLTEIPEDAWYCGSCITLGLVKADVAESVPVEEVKMEVECPAETADVSSAERAVRPLHRVKGRPGRPKKILSGLVGEEPVPVVRALKVAGRGRGRPPGSRRSTGPDAGMPKCLKTSANGQIRFKSATITPGVDDPSYMGTGYYPLSHSLHTNHIAGAGVAAVLSIIEHSAGKRAFWPAEKQVLSQMRDWAPLEDLQVAHTALVAQKELLLQRIRCFDPLFVEPISAARTVKNAVLLASKDARASDCSSSNSNSSDSAKKPLAAVAAQSDSATSASFAAADSLSSAPLCEPVFDLDLSLADESAVQKGEEQQEEPLLGDEELMAVDMDEDFLGCDDDEEGEGEGEGGVEGAEVEEEEEGNVDEDEEGEEDDDEGDGEGEIGLSVEEADEESKGGMDQDDDEGKNDDESAYQEDDEETDQGEEGNDDGSDEELDGEGEGQEEGDEDDEEHNGGDMDIEAEEEEEEESASASDLLDNDNEDLEQDCDTKEDEEGAEGEEQGGDSPSLGDEEGSDEPSTYPGQQQFSESTAE